MFVHEDERRILVEWANGNFKECKVLTAKQDCVVGDHWHAKKDEEFYLLSGEAPRVKVGSLIFLDIKAPYGFHVPRGTYHLIQLTAGSVLLGAATELFDPEDEIKECRRN